MYWILEEESRARFGSSEGALTPSNHYGGQALLWPFLKGLPDGGVIMVECFLYGLSKAEVNLMVSGDDALNFFY